VLKVLNPPGSGTVLLSDGMHLSVDGHRRVAEIMLPTVAQLMHARDSSAYNMSSPPPPNP